MPCGQSWTKNPGQGRSEQNQAPTDHCTPDRVGCPLLTAQVVEAQSCFSNFI